MPHEKSPLVVVSGASVGYFRCLEQFLRSARRRGLHRRHRFIAYDLGLLPGQSQALRQWFPWCEFRVFDFSAYPPHVALSAETYAWKPILIANLLDELERPVVWFDSATLLRAGLDELERDLRRYGVYTLAGQSSISARCAPLTLKALSAPPEILHLPERVAGVAGFDADHPVARRIARAWREHALIEAHIAPRTPRFIRHMPEQSLLSLLLFKAWFAGELELNPGEIDISSPDPVRWMSSRNKLPDDLPGWAAPLVHAGHALYKRADRLWLRWMRHVQPRLDGLLRLPHDHYRVLVRRGDAPPVRIPSPWHSYYADPFLWRHAGRDWLFVEAYSYLDSRGRLLALELDADLQVRQRVEPLAFACHASFPFPLEAEGRLYMIPETHAAGCVDLYVCDVFPDRWRRVQRLLSGVDAADSVAFFHADRWWLITSLRDAGEEKRFLGIFWSFDLLAGDWTPHPVNQERRRHGPGLLYQRAAGGVVRHEGQWLRPVQVNPHFYGESLAVVRIERLDETGYEESPYTGDHPFRALAERHPAHHIHQCGELLAWDIRDRVRWIDLLRTPPRRSGFTPPSA
ncbi:MAG: DUF1647 domain-containing protein [Betaproteobacteria bacterium]|nr:DUF1647 domain-containing protein [Betaproteobacteria bacterium]